MVNRYDPPCDPTTGKPLSYRERKAARQAGDDKRRKDEQAQRQADKEAAALAPPEPRPTFAQRQAARRAEDFGRRQATDAAEAKAKADAEPVNFYRERAAELKIKLDRGESVRDRYRLMVEKADQWDRQRADAKAAAEKRAAIDADDSVRLARDYAAGLVKLAPAEFADEAHECLGIAEAGDATQAWARMSALDQKIFQRADRLAAEKLAGKMITVFEFSQAASEAEALRERAEESAKMVEPNE